MPTWETLRSLPQCRYKAWLQSKTTSKDIPSELDETVLHVYLPLDTVSTHDKLATLAWFYAQPERQTKSTTKLLLHSSAQTTRIKLGKVNAKAKKLLAATRELVQDPTPPRFFCNGLPSYNKRWYCTARPCTRPILDIAL